LHYLENGIVNVDSSRCIGCAGCMMACPYGAIYMDPETNTADKCTYCAHRIESSMMPACVVVCPVQANIFGDIDDETSNISHYIMEHRGSVQVRKPEKHTDPKHFYVGGGNQTLNPLAHERIEGYGLFNNITHLEHIGDPNESIIDRFLEPFKSKEKYDNKSFMDFEKSTKTEKHEGGH
jgi:ferredoxin